MLHNVYVGDAQNNRVLVYADPFAVLAGSDQANDFAAFAVFGQAGSFITNAANENGLSADSLSSPQGVALDASNNLFVADVNNNRALIFFSPIPMTQVQGVVGNFGDATADVAVGQPNLASGECNRGGSATLTSLCIAPFLGVGIAVDGADNLYLADTENDRALEYNGPFGYGQTNNVTADLVFEGNNLAHPSGVAADSNGNFYVSSGAAQPGVRVHAAGAADDGQPAQPHDRARRAESECGVAAISDGAGGRRGQQSVRRRPGEQPGAGVQ